MTNLIAQLDFEPDQIPMRWFNAVFGRIFLGINRTAWLEDVRGRLLAVLRPCRRLRADRRTTLARPRFTVHQEQAAQEAAPARAAVVPVAVDRHPGVAVVAAADVLAADAQGPDAAGRGLDGGLCRLPGRAPRVGHDDGDAVARQPLQELPGPARARRHHQGDRGRPARACQGRAVQPAVVRLLGRAKDDDRACCAFPSRFNVRAR